jgi:hypothetical protein
MVRMHRVSRRLKDPGAGFESEQMFIRVGRDQRHGATVAFVGLEPCAVQQVARDHALYHLQHRRGELGLRSQQQTQRDGLPVR